MALRDIDSYPPQEPFSEIGAKYNVEVQKLSAGIDGDAFAYGGDPYQEVAVFEAANPNGTVLAFNIVLGSTTTRCRMTISIPMPCRTWAGG